MTPHSLWNTPFFDTSHAAIVERFAEWDIPYADNEPEDFDGLAKASFELARAMGECGMLDTIVPPGAESGAVRTDVRAMSIVREILCYRSTLADVVYSNQGIGSAAIWRFGSDELRAKYLPPIREGRAIASMALSEPGAGSDVAGISTCAVRDGADYVINGTKTWISNAGIAHHYIVVARTGEAPGAKGLSAFLVDADTPGIGFGPPITFIAPHIGSEIYFEDVRVPASRMLSRPGGGMGVAMATLDIFRTTVGAAALGVARRAYDEALARVAERRMFGSLMAEIDGIQVKLADMAVQLQTASLAVYHAAWLKDTTGERCTEEASIAKMVATEAAQSIVDTAVQLHGGRGLVHGEVVERLYREVRPMRIYEGATEIQQRIIGRGIARRVLNPAG